MNRRYYSLIVLCLMLFAANTKAEIQIDSLVFRANEHYVDNDFDKAAELYQTLVDSGYQSADIYFNLGNAYFKLNRMPYAILNFERAYRLNPGDEDIEFNLEYARTFTVDRIEPLPVFFLLKWYRSVRQILPSNGWAWSSLFWIAITLSLALIFWFALKPFTKRLTFSLGIISLAFAIVSIVFSAQEKENETIRDKAIIFQPVVTVKSSPGETGNEIFILHSGTKVQITKALGKWVEIRIADGNKGWIPSESVELI